MNKTELRAAAALAFVYVLRMLGLFMVMPVLAVLATDFVDFSPWLLGLAVGGYGLTQALLQIPMGVLSDKLGRKPVIVFGLLIFALGSALAAYADSLAMLVAGRLLQGAGAIAGAVMALAGDVSRENERSKVMAIIGIAIGFSFYLALLIGPPIAEYGGLRGIFILTALAAGLCVPVVIWAVPAATNFAPTGDTLPVLADIRRLFFQADLLKLNISVALLHFFITLLFLQLPLLLSAQGLALDQHWSAYLPVLLGSVLGMALLMRLAKRVGQETILRLSIVLLALTFIGFYLFGGHFWILMILAWLFFTGFNFLEANFPALVSSIAPAGKKGTAMGIYASWQFFGAFAGGAISGLLSQFFVPDLVLILAAGLCLLWLFISKGIGSTDLLKRYTLGVNVSAQSAAQLSRKLAALEGVQDITILPEQQVAYLKVDSQIFDLRAARQVAKTE